MKAAILAILLAAPVSCAWCGAARAQICTATATLVAFGAYDATSSRPTDSIGTVTVSCMGPPNAAVTYRISFMGGLSHRLSAGTGPVYQLYVDAERTRVWGDCTGGTSCVTDGFVLGLSGVHRSYTVYSRMPPHQRVPPGSLTDAVVVMLSY